MASGILCDSARTADALGSLALRIDHIGTTLVPGLAAKDIIDIQVTVLQFSPDLEAVFQRAGYLHRTEITHDHRPPTVSTPTQK